MNIRGNIQVTDDPWDSRILLEAVSDKSQILTILLTRQQANNLKETLTEVLTHT